MREGEGGRKEREGEGRAGGEDKISFPRPWFHRKKMASSLSP